MLITLIAAAEPVDSSHEDSEPLTTSTVFVYTRKPTLSFLFFLDDVELTSVGD